MLSLLSQSQSPHTVFDQKDSQVATCEERIWPGRASVKPVGMCGAYFGSCSFNTLVLLLYSTVQYDYLHNIKLHSELWLLCLSSLCKAEVSNYYYQGKAVCLKSVSWMQKLPNLCHLILSGQALRLQILLFLPSMTGYWLSAITVTSLSVMTMEIHSPQYTLQWFQ